LLLVVVAVELEALAVVEEQVDYALQLLLQVVVAL
jgi:hypothetical protein